MEGLGVDGRIILQGVQLKSGPYGPYFNISNLFTQWKTTPKNLPRMQGTSRLTELWSLPRPAQGPNTYK